MVLGGSLVALSGCQAATDTADAPTPSMDPEVDAILDRRATALANEDAPGWLAAVDAGNPALVAHEKQVLANLRQLAPEQVRFRRCGRGPDPVAPGRYASSLPLQSIAYDVDLTMRLPGVDAAATTVRHRYVFGRVDGAVTLVDVARGAAVGGEPVPLTDCPWDTCALQVRRRPGVLLAAQSDVDNADALAEVAAQAVTELRRDWGENPLPESFAVFVAADTDTFRGWFGGAAPDWTDGVTVAVRRAGAKDSGDGRYAGTRIAIDLPASRTAGSPYETIKRQLGYAAGLAMLPASPRPASLPGAAEIGAPLWAVEGFAQYLAGRDSSAVRGRAQTRLRAARLAAEPELGAEPELAANPSFYAAPARSTNLALASSLFQFVAGRYGHRRARELYLAAVTRPAGKSAEPDPQAGLAGALARAGLVGASQADAASTDFYAQWRHFVLRS
ncbi:hypothetical protein [Plantactinospora sp. KBS50]|uniref:hypothetical protein n=1 Tax=Plantactinospora sp. KBS50 TaxID=2024580 RepID=UPI000BAAE9BC|nr:hypothetical protein [Plantactinospora sp. KBS50]ASW54968.1 hypothetical protein CIK06_13385 [Plantactinospora sp. KBS50]